MAMLKLKLFANRSMWFATIVLVMQVAFEFPVLSFEFTGWLLFCAIKFGRNLSVALVVNLFFGPIGNDW